MRKNSLCWEMGKYYKPFLSVVIKLWKQKDFFQNNELAM